MARLAISKDYFAAYAKLPRKAQRKADEFLVKFQKDSTSAAIHLEPLRGVLDKQLRSARIGDDYRIILRAPESGDVFLILWADHHDEAYRWACSKQTAVHPATGSLQIYDAALAVRAITEPEDSPEPTPPPKGPPASGPQIPLPEASGPLPQTLLGAFSDEDLFLAGVPRPLLPSVRSVLNEDELDLLLPHLPPEAGEVLTGLAAGLALDEALEEVLGKVAPPAGAPTPPPVDTTDVAAALERETTQRQFRFFDGTLDLDAALKHPLDVWRVFLHPRQRRIAQARTKGPMRVLGGAGTGKTVVALHRAAFLVREVFKKPDDRVLFTTYTVNLAHDIRSQLAKLLEPDDLARVEVVHIDRWAFEYLRSRGKQPRIAYDADQKDALRSAVEVYGVNGYSFDFYRTELRDVVIDQAITTEDAYVQAVRRYRGVPLARTERRKIWPVFAAYREGLESSGMVEPLDVFRRARTELEAQAGPPRYQSVIVDEVQDFSADALKLVRAIAGPERPDDLFLVGDAHQRIYGRAVALSTCGINVRGRRSQTLRLNYRTTGAICRWSLQTLKDVEVDDLDEGKADRRGYVSLREGAQPAVRVFATAREEEDAVVDIVKDCVTRGVPLEGICVVARTKSPLQGRIGPALERAGISTVTLEQEEPKLPGVRLATMHRVKGLEFSVVVLVNVSKGDVPYESAELRSEDPVVSAQALLQERCLLYVAASRARDELYVTAQGAISTLLEKLVAQTPAPKTRTVPPPPRQALKNRIGAGSSPPPPPVAPTPAGTVASTVVDLGVSSSVLLTSLNLPTRLSNWADRNGLRTLADLARWSPERLLAERNLGRGSVAAARAAVERAVGARWETLNIDTASEGGATATLTLEAAAAEGWDEVRGVLSPEQKNVLLADVDLPARIRSFIHAEALTTVGDLANKSESAISGAKNMGRGSLRALATAVAEHFAHSAGNDEVSSLGLLEGFRAMVEQQEQMLRIIVSRRAGLSGEPSTLAELGDTFGVSRERIRQLEGKMGEALRRSPWARATQTHTARVLEGGARSLAELAEEPFFRGCAEQAAVTGYILDVILELGAYVIEWDEEPWLSRQKSPVVDAAWNQVVAGAKTIPVPAPFVKFEPLIAAAAEKVGPTLAARMRENLKAVIRLDASGENVLAGGDSSVDEILAVLRASPAPIHVDELRRRVGRRVNIPEDVIYFDSGMVGLAQHFQDFDGYQARLVPRAKQIMETSGPERQWSCAELIDELREEVELPPWLNEWCLSALIRKGTGINYLGRLRVALPGSADNKDRVYVRDGAEKLLREAGGPIPRARLLEKLGQRLGASGFTITMTLSKPPFVRVTDDDIGLADRDVPGGAEAIAEAMDHLAAILERRGRGLSAFHAQQEVASLSKVHAQWSEELTLSLLRGDSRFRLSQSGAVGLSVWEGTRVPTRFELVKSALDESDGCVSVEAVMARIEANYGSRPTRASLTGMAQTLGAGLDGESVKRRTVTDLLGGSTS